MRDIGFDYKWMNVRNNQNSDWINTSSKKINTQSIWHPLCKILTTSDNFKQSKTCHYYPFFEFSNKYSLKKIVSVRKTYFAWKDFKIVTPSRFEAWQELNGARRVRQRINIVIDFRFVQKNKKVLTRLICRVSVAKNWQLFGWKKIEKRTGNSKLFNFFFKN